MSVTETTQRLYNIRGVAVHPQSDGAPLYPDYDVAVLTLSQDAEFSDAIQPTCLPRSGREPGANGVECYATGWGSTNSEFPYFIVSAFLHQ